MFRIKIGDNRFWNFEENCVTNQKDERIYTESELEANNIVEYIKDVFEDVKISVEEFKGENR